MSPALTRANTLGRTWEEHKALERAYEEAIEALTSVTVRMPNGGLWEGPWELTTNVVVGSPCPHCRPFMSRPGWNYPSGWSWDDAQFVCPRVVVAYNEGGMCTTGTCLDCILEAVK